MAEVLTLAGAAAILRDAVKDKSYRATPLGLAAGRYLRWKRNEWGARPETLRDYEMTLAALCLYYADLEPGDFEPPVGTERLREFIDQAWGENSASTRAKKLSTLKDFYRWLVVDERALYGDPTLPIRRPRKADPERRTFSVAEQEQIIRACTRSRDFVAAGLILSYGLRKGEIRRIQVQDYVDGTLLVHGKGGRIRRIPIVDSILGAAIQLHFDKRAPQEYLLYPEKRRRIVSPDRDETVTIAEYPLRMLSDTATHMWWARLLEAAGVPHLRMHAGRHTALTAIWRKTGDLKLVQQVAGHKTIQTTGDIYTHAFTSDLERGLRKAFE